MAPGGWAGLGWGCWDDTQSDITWEAYTNRKVHSDGRVNDSVRLLHDLPVGALLWTRRREGTYWLGEIVGDWRYNGGQTARDLDLFNLRPCRWWPVGTEDAVPGKIVGNFRAAKTLNPVTDRIAVYYTRRLHAQLASRDSDVERLEPREIIASLLAAEAVEDLVAVYLQDRYNMLLTARGRSTPGYEYVLRERGTGRRAVCSVKSGHDPVDLDRLPDDPDISVFAFAVSGLYSGRPRPDVTQITIEELSEFMITRRAVLPDLVSRWLGK